MLEITGVKGSTAKKYNLKKGDKIVSFDGFPATDSLDYLYYDSKPHFTLTVINTAGVERVITIDKPEDTSLELTFTESGKIRTCRNKCIFCFVDQMGKGMRDSLYVKDDDYTMSFMCGNFVTLTNVDDDELERIIRLHLSPLYVSVHATDGALRCKLMGNRFAGKIVEQLKKLTEAKITVHCQAVIVPKLNDGNALEQTARTLFTMYPYVADVAVVPTGLTKFREGLYEIPDVTAQDAAELLDLCDRLNAEFNADFLLPADEYFVKCGRQFKPVEFYGDFAQIENGIGMTAKFISDFNASVYNAARRKQARVAVVTGVSAAKTIQYACDTANEAVKNLHAFALPVVNKFFGATVTCTGLLTGGDIAAELLKHTEDYDAAVIPANTLKEFEDVFLDGMTVKRLKKILKGKKIIINRRQDGLFENLVKA